MKDKHPSLLLVGSGKHWALLGAILEVPLFLAVSIVLYSLYLLNMPRT